MPDFSPLKVYDQERITVDNTVGGKSLTISKYITTPPGKAANVYVETAQIRYLTDGTAPTATTGIVANPTDEIKLRNASELENFRAIRTGATSGAIQVVYYRRP